MAVTPNYDTVKIDAPQEEDGRPVFVMSPARNGWRTWFHGAGDNLVSGSRGNGQRMRLTLTGSGHYDYIDVQYTEPVEVHDGQAYYTPVDNWSMDDVLEMSIIMPPTTISLNMGFGNCITSSVGGLYDVYLPYTSGTHDIDLLDAVPVPAEANDGYWDVDNETGIVSAAVWGSGSHNLISVPVEVYFIRNFPMGHPLGVLDVDTYKTEWIHNNWTLRIHVTKNSSGSGEFAAWLLGFRKYSTIY